MRPHPSSTSRCSRHGSAGTPSHAKNASRLAVNLGERRVGTLTDDAASTFADVMADAEFRGELLSTRAHLAKRNRAPRYVLEIAAPHVQTNPSGLR